MPIKVEHSDLLYWATRNFCGKKRNKNIIDFESQSESGQEPQTFISYMCIGILLTFAVNDILIELCNQPVNIYVRTSLAFLRDVNLFILPLV